MNNEIHLGVTCQGFKFIQKLDIFETKKCNQSIKERYFSTLFHLF